MKEMGEGIVISLPVCLSHSKSIKWVRVIVLHNVGSICDPVKDPDQHCGTRIDLVNFQQYLHTNSGTIHLVRAVYLYKVGSIRDLFLLKVDPDLDRKSRTSFCFFPALTAG